MVIEISVGAVAAAFVLLVIYLITTLQKTKKTLVQINKTAISLENDTHQVLTNANGLITETRGVVAHVKTKTENTESLFQAIDKISKQISEVSNFVSKAAVEHKEKLGGVLAIVGAAMNLAQEWRQNSQKRRMNDDQ